MSTKTQSPSHEIVLTFKATNAGHGPECEVPIQIECVRAVQDLLCAHYAEICKCREDNNDRVSVVATFNINDSGEQPKVKTRIRFGSKYLDNREVDIDVNQKLFAFDA